MKTSIFTLFALLFVIGLLGGTQTITPAQRLKADFDTRYQTWREWCVKQSEHALWTGPEFRAIVELGPPAAPYIADHLLHPADEREAVNLAEALSRVTGKIFSHTEWPEGKYLNPQAKVELYRKWWTDGRRDTPAAFQRLYARWKELRAKGETLFIRSTYTESFDEQEKTVKSTRKEERTELADIYDGMHNQGVDILPLIAEQLKAGDSDLLPIFRDLTHYVPRGKNTPERLTACVNWWEANKGEWEIPAN